MADAVAQLSDAKAEACEFTLTICQAACSEASTRFEFTAQTYSFIRKGGESSQAQQKARASHASDQT